VERPRLSRSAGAHALRGIKHGNAG